MAAEPRREAQARADQIRAFRRELRALGDADVVRLSEAQEAEVGAYHERLLATLARDFDVDRSEHQGQLSRGLRLASLFGAAALVAAITALVQRVWGGLALPAQVTLLTVFPLAALAGIHVAAEREQTRYVLENLKTLLAQGGATLDDVVRVVVYIRDMADFRAIHEVRARYFTKDPPASTMVEVSRLVNDDMLIEIEATAVVCA